MDTYQEPVDPVAKYISIKLKTKLECYKDKLFE